MSRLTYPSCRPDSKVGNKYCQNAPEIGHRVTKKYGDHPWRVERPIRDMNCFEHGKHEEDALEDEHRDQVGVHVGT